jgi:NhaP-type Na+/H+ or K+/H+ antiporter
MARSDQVAKKYWSGFGSTVVIMVVVPAVRDQLGLIPAFLVGAAAGAATWFLLTRMLRINEREVAEPRLWMLPLAAAALFAVWSVAAQAAVLGVAAVLSLGVAALSWVRARPSSRRTGRSR